MKLSMKPQRSTSKADRKLPPIVRPPYRGRLRTDAIRSTLKMPTPERKPANPDDPQIDRDKIARLAYKYWEARGFTGGSPEEDWMRAEQEFRERLVTQQKTG